MFTQTTVVRQAGALPFVRIGREIEVLLITSRRRQRWIMPKGWPEKQLSLADQAAREALEEAGAVGPVHRQPIGSYSYTKRTPGHQTRCRVFVYPLLVVEQRLSWPEIGHRRLSWQRLADAVALVDDRGLGRLLERLARNRGEALLDLAVTLAAGSAVLEHESA